MTRFIAIIVLLATTLVSPLRGQDAAVDSARKESPSARAARVRAEKCREMARQIRATPNPTPVSATLSPEEIALDSEIVEIRLKIAGLLDAMASAHAATNAEKLRSLNQEKERLETAVLFALEQRKNVAEIAALKRRVAAAPATATTRLVVLLAEREQLLSRRAEIRAQLNALSKELTALQARERANHNLIGAVLSKAALDAKTPQPDSPSARQ